MQERIVFAGTPDFAAVHLKALLEAGIIPVAVYTQPDRRAGRGHHLTPSPVKVLAQEAGIPVYQPVNFRDEADIRTFESLKADLAIVVAWGVILPERVLKAPRLGCINVHGSLLPRYRGAAPIQRALLDGQSGTGVTIMQIARELDAGDMLVKASLKIEDDDTSGTLFEKLAHLGAKTLVESLPRILEGSLTPEKQDPSEVTYAAKIDKSEAQLDFNLSSRELDLKVRGLSPWPKAVFTHQGITYKVLKAAPSTAATGKIPGTIVAVDRAGIHIATTDGTLTLITIQAPGKGPVSAADLARSRPELFVPGTHLQD